MKLASIFFLSVSLIGLVLQAQSAATDEDKLRLQVVLLRGQLAEALKAQAKCEAEGSQASRQLQDAQTEGQALLKALDARGLTIDQTNTIVPKPAPEKKP
jgi:Skp family chaperone for outer membrane proteins